MSTLRSSKVEAERALLAKKSQIGKGGASSSLAVAKHPQPTPPPPPSSFVPLHPSQPTQFRTFYDRGDLPIQVAFDGAHRKVQWKVSFDKLDYFHYLPIFFDGVREKQEPYQFLARQGTYDLLSKASGSNGQNRVLAVIPQLIIPMKAALNTKDIEVVSEMLKIMQKLVLSGKLIGEALVPYYRQLLPVCNLLANKNKNIGDMIDYGQQKRGTVGDLVEETLEILEVNGGEDAFINIKYMIPTYESKVVR